MCVCVYVRVHMNVYELIQHVYGAHTTYIHAYIRESADEISSETAICMFKELFDSFLRDGHRVQVSCII